MLPRLHPRFKDLYTITCKNSDCAKPIVLPLPIRHDNSPTQHLWPTDEKPRNFLCRECSHVYEYTFEDVHLIPGEGQALSEGLVDDTVFRIEARCGEENCGLPVYILLTGPSWQNTIAVKHDWLEKDKHGMARCSSRHMTGRIIPGSVDVHVDQDWK